MAKQEKTQKRADRPKQCAQTSEFKKSWDRYNRAGRRDMNDVRKVMAMLFLGAAVTGRISGSCADWRLVWIPRVSYRWRFSDGL